MKIEINTLKFLIHIIHNMPQRKHKNPLENEILKKNSLHTMLNHDVHDSNQMDLKEIIFSSPQLMRFFSSFHAELILENRVINVYK